MNVQIKESLQIVGALRIFKNNELVVEDNNMVVNGGKELVARLITGQGEVITQIRVGDNGTQASPFDDNVLGRLLGTTYLEHRGGMIIPGAPMSIEFDGTFPVGIGLGAVRECGLFNDLNEMLARKAFPEVNIGVDDSISFFWTITVK
jgi:hypothetical protein